VVVTMYVSLFNNTMNSKKNEDEELKQKILAGLDLAYKRLIEYKRAKNSVLVVMRDGKIVHVKPEELQKENENDSH